MAEVDPEKRVRRIRKKLIQISNLEVLGRELNDEELLKVDKKGGLRSELVNLLNNIEAMKRKQHADVAPDLNSNTSPNKVARSSHSAGGKSSRSSRSTGTATQHQDQPLSTHQDPPLRSAEPSSSISLAQCSTQNDVTTTTTSARITTTTVVATAEDEVDGVGQHQQQEVVLTTTAVPSSSTVVTSSSGQPRQIKGNQLAKQSELNRGTETVKLWRRRSWTVDQLEGHEDRILDCDINIQHNLLVTSSCDTTVKVWDLTTGATIFTACNVK
jgi:WD40 repeat protein